MSSKRLPGDDGGGGGGGRGRGRSLLRKRQRECGDGRAGSLRPAAAASPAPSFDLGCRTLQDVNTGTSCVQAAAEGLESDNINQCSSRERTEKNQHPDYKLIFHNSVPRKIFTNEKVQAVNGGPIKIQMVTSNQQGRNCSLVPSANNVEIVVLHGHFNEKNRPRWTSEEFDEHIVLPRDKVGRVIAGKLDVQLEADGVGYLHDVTFLDISRFTRTGKFRLGVKLSDDLVERVQEGITEPFTVKHCRGKALQKSDIPELNDEVWRLKGIAKNGVYHRALKQNGIPLVKDFLRQYYKDEKALRDILGIVLDSVWKPIVDHAMKCDPGRDLYSYFIEDKTVGATIAGQYSTFDELETTMKDLVEERSKDAYEYMTYHRPDYEMCDKEPRQTDEAGQQETSKGNETSGSHSQQCTYERLGSVQPRPFASAHGNNAIVWEYLREHIDLIFRKLGSMEEQIQVRAQKENLALMSKLERIEEKIQFLTRKENLASDKLESMEEQIQVRAQKENLALMSKLESIEEKIQFVIKKENLASDKLESMEEQIQILTQKEKAALRKLESIAECIQTVPHEELQDKITPSCHKHHNHEPLVEKAKQQRTGASAEAEGLASDQDEGRSTRFQLRFLDRMRSPIYREEELKSEDNTDIRIGIFDGEDIIKSGQLSNLKIDILALEGNFPYDAWGSWTSSEFNEHRAGGRDGKGNVLAGESTTIQLINGESHLVNIVFKEGSCKARQGKFVVGARVCDGEAMGVRIQEAIMNPVVVQDPRIKGRPRSATGTASSCCFVIGKSYPPMPNHSVHCLEEISKDGTYYKRLAENKIHTVEDFLKALNKDPDNLARILRINKEHLTWEKMVRHARECCLLGRHELKSYPWMEGTIILFFNCVHDLVGAQFGGSYTPRDKFDRTKQVIVDELRVSAYDYLDALGPDYVMTETDDCPRQTGDLSVYNALILENPPSPEDLIQAKMESFRAAMNNKADPHSTHNNEDKRTRFVSQEQTSSASDGFWCGLEELDSAFRITDNNCSFRCDDMDCDPFQEYSTDYGALSDNAIEQHLTSVELGLDPMEILAQGNDTFEAPTSAHNNMTFVEQQLAVPEVLQDQLKVACESRCRLPSPTTGTSCTAMTSIAVPSTRCKQVLNIGNMYSFITSGNTVGRLEIAPLR
ncbi:hypothetical protein ACP70R_032289 [Stipagrostis hirtigluma subsp. patula]